MNVFFGSSKESLPFLETLASWLEPVPDTTILLWNAPEVFPAGGFTLERLLELTRFCDAALFLFGEDDKVWYRETQHSQPRDNVLFEYGLFASQLGIQNTLICRVAGTRIASDLLGVTTVNIADGHRLDAKKRIEHWYSLCQQNSQSGSSPIAKYPKCEHVARHLLSDEIQRSMETLPEWSVVRRPSEKSLSIQTLIQRRFKFGSFEAAMEFMQSARPTFEQLDHHPEWENVYDAVTVRTTTWGVGCQLTALDFRLAHQLDQIYEKR